MNERTDAATATGVADSSHAGRTQAFVCDRGNARAGDLPGNSRVERGKALICREGRPNRVRSPRRARQAAVTRLDDGVVGKRAAGGSVAADNRPSARLGCSGSRAEGARRAVENRDDLISQSGHCADRGDGNECEKHGILSHRGALLIDQECIDKLYVGISSVALGSAADASTTGTPIEQGLCHGSGRQTGAVAAASARRAQRCRCAVEVTIAVGYTASDGPSGEHSKPRQTCRLPVCDT